jgi:putative transposase
LLYPNTMSEKFQNKYRISSSRLKNWNYSLDAAYFITICAYKHECYFGAVANGEMQLSGIGEIVKTEWEKSFEMRAELFCDVYVIMPNHIHAILIIDKNNLGDSVGENIETQGGFVETHGRASLRQNKNTGIAYRSPKSISSFVAGFKSSVTKQVRKIHADFNWQSRFHDHIIRNQQSWQNISNYIQNNPMKWEEDKFHKQ